MKLRQATQIFALSAAFFAAGCGAGSAPKSTRLTADDYPLATGKMIDELERSPFFASRTTDSPRMVVTVKQVTNLTTDLIPEGEQWMYVLRVWNDPEVRKLALSKNVVTQVSHDRLVALRKQFPDATSGVEAPTEEMTAEFATATRVDADDAGDQANRRAEYYQLNFAITNIKTGAIDWSGLVTFKKEAKGTLIN